MFVDRFSKFIFPMKAETISHFFQMLGDENIRERNATLAVYSMFRGFLNVMDAESPECSNRFICESAFEASKHGQIGNMVAKISR